MSTRPGRTAIGFTPLSPDPNSGSKSVTRTTINRDPRARSQSRATQDSSADHVPVEHSNAYTPRPNPPAAKRMVPSGLIPPSLDGYPSPANEESFPSEQIIRLECSPRKNGQSYGNEFQRSAASYVEASYQPPPPVQASYQPPPPPQTNRNNVRRALPVPGKAARLGALPRMDGHPPSYSPPSVSLPHSTSRVLPTPPVSLANSTSPFQSFSRSYSPTSTELPDYASGQVSDFQIDHPPLQIPVNYSAPPRPVRQEYYAQYPETDSNYSPSTAQPPRRTPSLVSVSNSRIQYTNSSASTGKKVWNSGSENGSSVPSSPMRHAFHLSATPLLPSSGSSDSSGGNSSTSGGVTNIPSASFVFPGSRSVARPKAGPKTKSRTDSKSWRWKNLTRKSPLSEPPHSIPTLHTAPPSTALPNPSQAAIVSTSSNPTNVLPMFPDITYHETSSVFSDESRNTKASTSSANSSRVYVFPVGRSRAQPKRDPHASKGQQSWKFSGGAGGGKSEGKRTGLMGMLLKKKTKAPKSDGSNTISTDSVASEPTEEATTHGNADMPKSYQVIQAPMHDESQEQGKHMKSRIGSYPLDPYDSVLLDNDRHTGELLARLNPTGSPSFHNYGNTPPTSVLDLGCGQGHWVVDAAIAWKGYGTKITGYDMVDVSKDLLPWVIEQGVNQNVQFIRGNFLHQHLPFSNDSFDLVRMSCLALCITSDSWIFVLQEVFRVLMVGGRLELIDDLIFFPYGKESTLLGIFDAAVKPQVPSLAPRLDITIPSASFRTFSIYAGEINNPGLGVGLDDDGTKAIYELYGVEEEDVGDTVTLSGRSGIHAPAVPSYNLQTIQTRTDTSSNFDVKLHSWARAHNNSEDLEALFEHMLVHKFGINKNPSEFVLGLMKEVFGHAQEINTMHITLAPPKPGMDNGEGFHGRRHSSFPRSSRRESMGLSQAPGLVLWPSTFIPMDQAEIEIHASKHLRMLLSCKDFLLEHAIEVTDDDEIDGRAVLEGLEEYESFLRRRFDPPVVLDSSPGDRDSETVSIQGSIAESVSSDGLDAMREIESELRPRFSWQGSPSQDQLVPATLSTPKPIDQLTASKFSSSVSAPIDVISSLNCPRRDTDGPLISSHEGPTHIRTFRIYEAIKIDEAIFGSSMRGLSGLRTQSPVKANK